MVVGVCSRNEFELEYYLTEPMRAPSHHQNKSIYVVVQRNTCVDIVDECTSRGVVMDACGHMGNDGSEVL